MNKLARLLAVMLAVVLCTACVTGLAEEPVPTPELSPTAEPVVTPDPNAVLLTVNGTEVTRAEVDNYASYLLEMYGQSGYDTSDAALAAFVNQQAFTVAVQETLIKQKIAQGGYDQFTDEERAQIESENAAEWASAVDMYMQYYGGVTAESTEEEIAAARENILTMLAGMGYTEEQQLKYALETAAYEKLEADMAQGAAVTDEEVQASFDERVKTDESAYKTDVASYEYMTQYYGETSYYIPEGYRGVTHILLEVDESLMAEYQELTAKMEEQQDAAESPATPTDVATTTDVAEEPVTQEDVDAAYAAIIASVQPTIDEINAKLAEGVSFAELIVEYGKDPGMSQEPQKSEGYSVHMDSIAWDPAFVKAAFSVNNVGDIAQPVVGNYGVHIVQYTRDVPAGAIVMTDEIKNAIYEELLAAKENEQIVAVMNQWIEEADVVYAEEAQALLGMTAAEEEPAEEAAEETAEAAE